MVWREYGREKMAEYLEQKKQRLEAENSHFYREMYFFLMREMCTVFVFRFLCQQRSRVQADTITPAKLHS